MQDVYMTIRELANYLKVKQSTVYNWINNERIPVSKVVGQWRFRRNEIDQWIKDSNNNNKKKKDKQISGQKIEGKRKDFSSYCAQWVSMDRPLPAQADAVYNRMEPQQPGGEYRDNMNLALALDSIPSRKAMFRDARKWLRKKNRAKKLRRILRPFF